MKVRQHGVRNSTEAAAEVCVYRRAIAADGDSLRICVAESIELRFQRREFDASGRGEIERIEEQEKMLLPCELLKGDVATKLIAKREGWGF